MSKKPQQVDKMNQAEKFRAMARAVEAADNEAAFDEALKRIGKSPPPAEKKRAAGRVRKP